MLSRSYVSCLQSFAKGTAYQFPNVVDAVFQMINTQCLLKEAIMYKASFDNYYIQIETELLLL